MPNYDFHNCLSPREFEELARDILEIKEKVIFKISSRGKDGGIDLIHREDKTKIIVQVKCYQNNYKQLRSVLKYQEKQKAKFLSPSRYILVVSLELSNEQRSEIISLFEGFIKTEDDIIDRNDLNQLLGKEQYHKVEQNHYKLWISSTGVLISIIEGIVHRASLVNSKFELDQIKETVKVFVQNPSFGRSLRLLEKFRYILISGEPGVGKTTLARCLAAYYLQHMGYGDFIYADTVRNALEMFKEKEKQVFFFDDFWGSVFKDEKLPHNEEKHMVKFIELVSRSKNKILILTSREYVLQQGLAEYHDEQLNRTFDIGKCMLQMEDYSEVIKAKIIFNHLYFSQLEWDYVEIIANHYEPIIKHSNYSPRIINDFLNHGMNLIEDNSPSEFYNAFKQYLDEPLSFWKSIFMHQTRGAQLAALILFLSSQPMRLCDLKHSYYTCLNFMNESNTSIRNLEFESIIAQLEKTMIKTYLSNGTAIILVEFQNPSVKDFLYLYLSDSLELFGQILIQGCPFLNQLLFMFKTTVSGRSIEDSSGDDIFIQKKINLTPTLEIMLTDKIITDFDILNYSYFDNDIFENKSSVYTKPDDCIVRKLNDIMFNFDVEKNSRMKEFVKSKIQYLCERLHDEDYPFSYGDMIEFPDLINRVLLLNIDLDEEIILEDYHRCSRFAEHWLTFTEFAGIFPKAYANFKKKNYKEIKAKIKYLLLDDIEFFASDMQYERIDFLIDIIYPRILDTFKLRDSKSFWKVFRFTMGYDNETKKNNQYEAERNMRIIERRESEEKIKEIINEEKRALLGSKAEALEDQEIIDFIIKNAQTASEAEEIVSLYEDEEPWFIYPFYGSWNRLSLLLEFYHDQKQIPATSLLFFEMLAAFLIKDSDSTNHVNNLREMFSEFALDMLRKGQTIFSAETLEKHKVFQTAFENNQVDLLEILSFPFIIQKGKWYMFQTVVFQAYLSLKVFLTHNTSKHSTSYKEFLDLQNDFWDFKHDVWLLCSEMDIVRFNEFFLVSAFQEYLNIIDSSNPKTVTSSTFKYLGLTLNFNIPSDTAFPENSGSSCKSLEASIFEFIGHDLLDIEFLMDSSSEEEVKEESLMDLSQFILKYGSKSYGENEFKIDLAEHNANHELLEIFNSLGVCDFLWNTYHQVQVMVKQAIEADYNYRLDSYKQAPQVRRFFSEE
ncbi:restriction endonuclease [Paenibacillus tritici]|uniref:Restriction endonuclease n=1 Tax=Paenibacillus tritici TaxID=1873425 RepID=A0ABX2DY57_9BACL|nr:restriction endonuclease [Paenibacillus tritici]NQX48336.1 restriction endonuclease [Paenibacillus tritici]QUL55731.1 restriction endonuclease [Paenibacillus tritici]